MIKPFSFSLAATLLVLTGLPLLAEPSDDEVKALKAVEQSYNDGAFDLCDSRATALLKKFPKSELAPQADLFQARALYQLGRSEAALAALDLPLDAMPDNLRAETLFWQGEILLDLNRWAEAEKKYRALLALKETAGHTDAANLGLAWTLFNQGREADALPILQGLAQDKTKGNASRQALLFLAKIGLEKRQIKEAITGMEGLLATNPEPKLALETSYWLGEAYAANGEPEKAVATYRKITDDPKAFPRKLVAKTWLALGRAQHALQQDDQAMLAYEQTYKLTEDETTRLEAFRAYLESARAGKQLPEAVAKLQEFARNSSASAPAALLAIASALAQDGSDDKAIGVLESLLVAYKTSAQVPEANYLLGQLYARTKKPAPAIKALQNCIAANSDPVLIRSARSQLGSVLLNQTKDYLGAAAQFALISDGTTPAAEDAAFNYLLALANIGKADPFLKAQADFEKTLSQEHPRESIAKVESQILADAGKKDDAKAVLQKAIALPGGGPDQLVLLKALVDLQYQTNDLEGTQATCDIIVKQFPNDALAAALRGILVGYEMKKMKDEDVEHELLGLLQKYGGSPGAPEAYFHLGEFYFFRQDYVKAQEQFQQLGTTFPNSDYADNAWFFAGRAAFAHQDYVAARTLLQKVPDKSALKSMARLWEGRVYQQQLDFPQAVSLYNAVLATDKTGPRFVEASLLKGHCLFEMGARDASNYTQAVATFEQILNGKEGTIAERNEAAVSEAKCQQKMGQIGDAMKLYLDVLYGRVAGDDSSSPTPPEFSWQIQAGWEAASIREAQKDWRGAIEVYKRLEQIGGAHQQLFHDNINRLRQENYIYE